MKLTVLVTAALCFGALASIGNAAPTTKPVFEELGAPLKFNEAIAFVTRGERGNIAWGNLRGADRRELAGVNMENGELTTVPLAPYGIGSRAVVFKDGEDTLHLFAGRPGRFFQYDVAKNVLAPLGAPSNATYWMGGAKAPDGKIYVGTFPEASVQILDTKTGTTQTIKQISPDTMEQYVTAVAVSDANEVYIAVGMHHAEVWHYNPATGQKRQILPAEITSKYGGPKLWTGTDGNVYGSADKSTFLCRPDGVDIGKTLPARADTDNEAAGKIAKYIDRRGNLILENKASGKQEVTPTKFENSAAQIYSIGDVHKGKIYGSTVFPGHLFSYDMARKRLSTPGAVTRGTIQIYDSLAHGKGLYLSSYGGGYIDFYDPTKPLQKGKNPIPVAHLEPEYQQERPVQLAQGPDGKVYCVTFPIKGYLGGTLVQVNPKDQSTKIWRNVIQDQSYTSIVPVKETGELFITASIQGGTSAVPTAKEACVFLWDTKTEKVSFQAQPIPGATSYYRAVRANNGVIYGFSGLKYYAFDPVQRKTVYVGELPSSGKAQNAWEPLLGKTLVGPRGFIYGVDRNEGRIFRIDPETHKIEIVAEDERLLRIIAANTAPDGYLYFGNGAQLMRYRLEP